MALLTIPQRTKTIEKIQLNIEIPAGMEAFFLEKNEQEALKRDALILYPHIMNGEMSHGRAAEILGINKRDLIDFYGEMGFAYYDMPLNELEQDIKTYYRVKGENTNDSGF